MDTTESKGTAIIHFIDCEVFPFVVMLSVGFTFEEMMEELKKLPDSEDWVEAFSSDNEKDIFSDCNYAASERVVHKEGAEYARRHYLIFIKDHFKYTDYEMCKLAHEVLHICQYAMHRFLDPQKETEAVAYVHTYIMKNVLKELREADEEIAKRNFDKSDKSDNTNIQFAAN